ncbi:MAG: hypothetical protein A2138_12025 [Deltaproteobacteria bacterium RBG_16_71_12]|nr:MAG: hypothetical protein A2138_12025 [Deltaproteobacteria bacterium RBG_16_71_12]
MHYRNSALHDVAELLRLRATIDAIIAREAPDVLVLNRDRGADVLECARRAARRVGAPVVAMDVGITSAAFKARTRRSQRHDARRGVSRVVPLLWPGQQRVVDGDPLLFYPPGKTAALALFALLPQHPWINGENGAHAHMMISGRSLDEARADGARCDNAVVVGLPSIDTLYAAHRERDAIAAELIAAHFGGRRNGKRLCVFPLPQLFEHKLMNREHALDEIEAVLAAAERTNQLLIVGSLHPTMDRTHYQHLERAHPDFALATSPLSRVMAAADLSINAFPTTVSWSLLVGAPAVFLDWFEQGYRLDHQPGCVVSRDRSRLTEQLLSTLACADELRVAIRSDVALLPPFDGRCKERAMQVLLDASASRRALGDERGGAARRGASVLATVSR